MDRETWLSILSSMDDHEMSEIAESILMEADIFKRQRDAANNRIKYLENLIRECHGKL